MLGANGERTFMQTPGPLRQAQRLWRIKFGHGVTEHLESPGGPRPDWAQGFGGYVQLPRRFCQRETVLKIGSRSPAPMPESFWRGLSCHFKLFLGLFKSNLGAK